MVVLAGLPAIGAASGGVPPVARSVTEFWSLPAASRDDGVVLEWDCVVTFYDPDWHVLFVQDSDGVGAYVNTGGQELALRSGDRIQARVQLPPGVVVPSFAGAILRPGGTARGEPINVGWAATYLDTLGSNYVRMEALVERIERNDPGHVRLALAAFGRRFAGWMLENEDRPLPDWEGSIVSITGVYNPRGERAGEYASRELMISSRSEVRVISSLADDSRFNRPVTPVKALEHASTDELVRVVGRMTGQDPGRQVQLRDDTGQITVLTAQQTHFLPNEVIEALGYPQVRGTSWQLRSGLVRGREELRKPERQVLTGPLRVAGDVLELTPEAAEQGYSVILQGVVTWSHPETPFFFIQDSSRGVAVWRGKVSDPVRPVGDQVEVIGRTRMGPFAPAVEASSWRTLALNALPIPQRVPLEQALSGTEEAQWVEMSGYVRGHRGVREGTALTVVNATGTFEAVVSGQVPEGVWRGAIVRVIGVCSAVADPERRLAGVTLWVPSRSEVLVQEEAPVNAFGAPLRKLAEIRRYGTFQAGYRRQRVQGTVFFVESPTRIRIMEGGDALAVSLAEPTKFEVGDLVEVAGFLNRHEGEVELGDAVARSNGRGATPQPVILTGTLANDAAHAGKLSQLKGRVVELTSLGGELKFSLSAGDAVYEIRLPGGTAVLPAELKVGATVEATGLFHVSRSAEGVPAAGRLSAATADQVRVTRPAPWISEGRVIAVLVGLVAVSFVSLAWVSILRRQVRRQTDQIREQVKREARLEADLQRASRLESLGHLAGGIAHDFNNLLTVMMGNLSIVRFDLELPPATAQALHEAELAAARAKDLTQQLLTFAKGGAPIRAATQLPDVIREVTEATLAGGVVRPSYQFSDGCWRANVDRAQIGQVVQNLVQNAAQAMPGGGEVRIHLLNTIVGSEMGPALEPGAYVLLEVSDDGPGIDPAHLPHIFDPYFTTKASGDGLGLATVHSIVMRHGGLVTVDSEPRRGATFRLWLPAAAETPTETAPAATAQTAPPVRIARRARVLFMDDEPQIRQTGAELLSRLGYEVSTAADGTEAVRLYGEAKAAAHAFDVVVLDLTVLGGMGGRDAMTELRKLDPDVRAVVSSGYSNDAVLAEYRSHGFAGMVSKPYEITDLSHTIDSVMRGKSA
jgi:two-component system, cell cycle sensor histidine kinase and response regulator CckA